MKRPAWAGAVHELGFQNSTPSLPTADSRPESGPHASGMYQLHQMGTATKRAFHPLRNQLFLVASLTTWPTTTYGTFVGSGWWPEESKVKPKTPSPSPDPL